MNAISIFFPFIFGQMTRIKKFEFNLHKNFLIKLNLLVIGNPTLLITKNNILISYFLFTSFGPKLQILERLTMRTSPVIWSLTVRQ